MAGFVHIWAPVGLWSAGNTARFLGCLVAIERRRIYTHVLTLSDCVYRGLS